MILSNLVWAKCQKSSQSALALAESQIDEIHDFVSTRPPSELSVFLFYLQFVLIISLEIFGIRECRASIKSNA